MILGHFQSRFLGFLILLNCDAQLLPHGVKWLSSHQDWLFLIVFLLTCLSSKLFPGPTAVSLLTLLCPVFIFLICYFSVLVSLPDRLTALSVHHEFWSLPLFRFPALIYAVFSGWVFVRFALKLGSSLRFSSTQKDGMAITMLSDQNWRSWIRL